MSDENPNPIPPPPSPKTSAVPLKKETVRITLRARPAAGVTQPREATAPVMPVPQAVKKATAPIQLPSAPLPPPAPKSSTTPVTLPPAPMPPPSAARPMPPVPTAVGAPPAPSAIGAPPAPTAVAPRPPVPVAPGAPMAPGAPVAPRAPGAPVVPGAAPRLETGATTAPLAPRPAPRPVGGGTSPMAAGGGTSALPKATVKLQGTPTPGRPKMATPSAAPIKRAAQKETEQFYEEKDPEAGLVPLSVVCLILGVVLLVIQILATDTVTSSPANQPSGLMVPEVVRVDWETQDATGAWRSSFDRLLPQIPQ